jgi:hypothetical protein
MMKALQEVVGKAGGSMSEASKNSILALIDDDASDQTGKFANYYKSICIDLTTLDAVAITNAKLLGALVKVLPAATAGPLIKYVIPYRRNSPVLTRSQEPCAYVQLVTLVDSWPQCFACRIPSISD